MGYPMAVNLGSKIGSDTTIYVCDVVQPVIEKYIQTLNGKLPIKTVKNGYEAAQVAVREGPFPSWLLICTTITWPLLTNFS